MKRSSAIKNFVGVSTLTLALILMFCTSAPAVGSKSAPQEIEVLQLSNRMKSLFADFTRQSLTYRMGYYYKSEFLNEQHKISTRKYAVETSNQIALIKQKLEDILVKIEDYPGDDWDLKYGKTGIWQQLKADIEKAAVAMIELDCWAVIANGRAKDDEIKNILQRWKKLELGNPGFKKFLLARIISVENSQKALDVYNSIDPNSFEQSLGVSLVLERSRLQLELGKSAQLSKLAEILNSQIGLENRLYAAFLLNRANVNDVIKNTVKKIPQTKPLVDEILYLDLVANFDGVINKISDFQIQLIANHMYSIGCDEIDKNLMEKIVGSSKFSTPEFAYLIAMCTKDPKPARAVDLLILAAETGNGNQLYDPKQAAYQAATIGYNLFKDDELFATLALNAFECLKRNDPDAFDDKMSFIYSKLLKFTADQDIYDQQMKKLAAGTSQYSLYARYEILTTELAQLDLNIDQMDKDLQYAFAELIEDSTEANKNDIADNAALAWGQFAVEDANSESTELFYQTTEKFDTKPKSLFYRASAAQKLQKILSSVQMCKQAIQQNQDYEKYLYEIYKVISTAADRIDWPRTKQDQEKYSKLLDNIDYIGTNVSQLKASLVRNAIVASWIEILAYTGKYGVDKQTIWQQILQTDQSDTLAFVRCRARINYSMGYFEKSAENWSDIAKYYKKPQNNNDFQWYKAKYYQLLSLSQTSGEKQSLKHHIEVLLKNNPQTENIWFEKISQLASNL